MFVDVCCLGQKIPYRELLIFVGFCCLDEKKSVELRPIRVPLTCGQVKPYAFDNA